MLWRLCLIVALLAMTATAALSHSWYTGKVNPHGSSCCNDQDCKPLDLDRNEVLEGETHYTFKWHGRHLKYPIKDAQPSEDGNFHACITTNDDPRDNGVVLCFFYPLNI
jgi:hypothetical protein